MSPKNGAASSATTVSNSATLSSVAVRLQHLRPLVEIVEIEVVILAVPHLVAGAMVVRMEK
jgi:hypothetical protein